MAETTPLDDAHAAMVAAPEDDAARLAFYGRLADTELFLMLEREAQGEDIAPRLFPLEDGPYVLVYDREDRLARFAGGPTPYAALPGRRVVAHLAGRGIGLALNLGEAPSEMLLPEDAVGWLAETLAARPEAATALPREVRPPHQLPQALLTALDARLARAQGLAACALLAEVAYADGARGHLLAFVDAAPGAEGTLARAANEALAFSGLEAGTLDVTCLPEAHVLTARLARVALRFDLPQAEAPTPPGREPDRPPKLR